MIRRLPIIPTIVVLAAVVLMIGLGVWQLRRAQWKEGLLAQYAHAERLPPISWPTEPLHSNALPLFRHATGMCVRPVAHRAVAGENRSGEPGYVHVVDCSTGAEGRGMSLESGWTNHSIAKVKWTGALVSRIVALDRRAQMRLVAASAPPGLEPSAEPSLASIPNNHRFYALQWFAFAAIALIIYALAVRKRLKQEPPSP